jgi:hypothetical protein
MIRFSPHDLLVSSALSTRPVRRSSSSCSRRRSLIVATLEQLGDGALVFRKGGLEASRKEAATRGVGSGSPCPRLGWRESRTPERQGSPAR